MYQRWLVWSFRMCDLLLLELIAGLCFGSLLYFKVGNMLPAISLVKFCNYHTGFYDTFWMSYFTQLQIDGASHVPQVKHLFRALIKSLLATVSLILGLRLGLENVLFLIFMV